MLFKKVEYFKTGYFDNFCEMNIYDKINLPKQNRKKNVDGKIEKY